MIIKGERHRLWGSAMPLGGWLGWVGIMWAKMDSNHRRYKPADLQSAPFGHSGIRPDETASRFICGCKYTHYFFNNTQFYAKKQKNVHFYMFLHSFSSVLSCSSRDAAVIPCCGRAVRSRTCVWRLRRLRRLCRRRGLRSGRGRPARCRR